VKVTNQSDFSLELDHVVIFVAADAPEAKTLAALGLQGFGGTTRHGDLGTASTAFFFENVYLELLWAHDEGQANQTFAPVGLDVGRRMRWPETAAAPFGLTLRHPLGSTGPIPFSTRQLRASWMPGEVFIDFSADNNAEPVYNVVPPELSYLAFKANIPDYPHPLDVKRVTGVTITLQGHDLSPAGRLLAEHGLVTFVTGSGPLLALTFDNGAQGKSADTRPALPLVLHY
jgi:hypothetical protein